MISLGFCYSDEAIIWIMEPLARMIGWLERLKTVGPKASVDMDKCFQSAMQATLSPCPGRATHIVRTLDTDRLSSDDDSVLIATPDPFDTLLRRAADEADRALRYHAFLVLVEEATRRADAMSRAQGQGPLLCISDYAHNAEHRTQLTENQRETIRSSTTRMFSLRTPSSLPSMHPRFDVSNALTMNTLPGSIRSAVQTPVPFHEPSSTIVPSSSDTFRTSSLSRNHHVQPTPNALTTSSHRG
ncbi:hypothetical protein BJ165DRAFT_1531195 [Panaeolus papilionaceus]|nr:hypothetical protein BJ165DRAFT_1531195 [Panaeolus papilionaceus]